MMKNTLGHKRYVGCMGVKICRHFASFSYISAIHQPETGRDCCCEGDAILNEGQWCRPGHIFPDCSRLTA